MRITNRLAITVGLSLAVIAVGAASAPPQASARAGLMVVPKKITLQFPSPGRYEGKVKVVRVKGKRVATTKTGARAGKKAKRNAKKKGKQRCLVRNLLEENVDVIHLSTPPFLIGFDKPVTSTGPATGGRYGVSGNEPPTGDFVRAQHPSGNFRVRTGKFRWEVRCKGAKRTRPYPF